MAGRTRERIIRGGLGRYLADRVNKSINGGIAFQAVFNEFETFFGAFLSFECQLFIFKLLIRFK